MHRLSTVLVLCLFAFPAMATEAGWALLREGGHVVLMRHAYAHGTMDPPNFDIEKCATQRNLTDRGRQQARRIGSLFAARAAPVERVLSSRLCRALDTARLAFGERYVEAFAPLDPYPVDEEAAMEARDAAIAAVAGYDGSGNFVLMADISIIQSLTGGPAREGEALIVTPVEGGLHVMARVVFN